MDNKPKEWRAPQDTVICSALLVMGALMLSGLLSMVLDMLLGNRVSAAGDEWMTIYSYAKTVTIWLPVIFLMLVIPRDRQFLRKLLPGGGNTVFNLLAGVLAGFAMNGICVLAAYLNGDIHLHFEGGSVLLFILAFIAVAIQSGSEEILMRVMFYQRVNRSYGAPGAVFWSSLVFMALHLANDGITVLSTVSLTLSGVVFGLCVYYFDSFILAAMIHTAWNYTQAILFGLPNSGIVTPFSVFKLDASTAADSFFYNVGFGIEGSWMSLIPELAAIGIIVLIGRKRRRCSPP